MKKIIQYKMLLVVISMAFFSAYGGQKEINNATNDLYDAVEKENLADVEKAIAAGADPNLYPETVIEIPSKGGSLKTAQKKRITPFKLAIRNGNLPIVKYLLDNKADVNEIMEPEDINYNVRFDDPRFLAPLHVAIKTAAKNKVDIVRELLNRNADPNIISASTLDTPLKETLFLPESAELVTILLEKGAEVDKDTFTRDYKLRDDNKKKNFEKAKIAYATHRKKVEQEMKKVPQISKLPPGLFEKGIAEYLD